VSIVPDVDPNDNANARREYTKSKRPHDLSPLYVYFLYLLHECSFTATILSMINHGGRWLLLILLLAFLLRLSGIAFGLPLWLIPDEPPFTAATLKMMELRTVLPVLHEEAFKKVIYFPPYLSYLYLPPFAAILATKYILFDGTLEQFKNYIVSDPSFLFLLVRFFNVIFGTLTVLLSYKISKNVFGRERSALLGAFFLAVSILHINQSFVGRDWAPVTFLFALAILLLTHKDWSPKKRSILAALIAGISFGVSLMGGFIMAFILCFYLFYERHSLQDAIKEKTLYLVLFLFLILAAVSIAIFPFGFVFLHYTSVADPKSLAEFVWTALYFFIPIFRSEPLLVIGALLGLVFCYKHLRHYFWTVVSFIAIYIVMFYFTYHYQPRFTVFLFPLFAGLAGYGFSQFYDGLHFRARRLLAVLVIGTATVFAMVFMVVVIKNDSRIAARNWVMTNLPEGAKIIVEARLLRLPTSKVAIEEQAAIDPLSLRQVDLAEKTFEKSPRGEKRFHALNLYTVSNADALLDFAEYAQKHEYDYLLIDAHITSGDVAGFEHIQALEQNATLLETFGKRQLSQSAESGAFSYPWEFFTMDRFGPELRLYRLNQ